MECFVAANFLEKLPRATSAKERGDRLPTQKRVGVSPCDKTLHFPLFCFVFFKSIKNPFYFWVLLQPAPSVNHESQRINKRSVCTVCPPAPIRWLPANHLAAGSLGPLTVSPPFHRLPALASGTNLPGWRFNSSIFEKFLSFDSASVSRNWVSEKSHPSYLAGGLQVQGLLELQHEFKFSLSNL